MTDVKTQAPEDILAFWLEEVGPDGWYKGGVALDTEITRRFLTTWEAACEGALSAWLSWPGAGLCLGQGGAGGGEMRGGQGLGHEGRGTGATVLLYADDAQRKPV